MALFSQTGLEATGAKTIYCPICGASLFFDQAADIYICQYCGWEISEKEEPIPYVLMADMLNRFA